MFETTSRGIPIHPQPSIFETTIGHVMTETGVTTVTPVIIDQILTRPRWDFCEADLRLTGERIAALQKEVDAVVAKRSRKTDKRTPRKKP